jgi:Leucine-rich repeat (LRR) protein
MCSQIAEKLSGLPLCLVNLSVSHNLLTKIYGLEALHSLQTLDVSFNHIMSIGQSLASNSMLRKLLIGNNHLKKIEGLDHLIKLQQLR